MIFVPAILYVDDEQVNLDTFKRAFGSDFRIKTCLSAEEALQVLEEQDFSMVVSDQKMPGMSGIELCEKIIRIRPDAIRIILTAFSETQMLLDAIHRGHVHDYIVKPWKKSELKPVLEKHFEDYKQRKAKLQELEMHASQAQQMKEELGNIYDLTRLVGAGSGLKQVLKTIEKAAPTDSTILLLGETGTGKELVARLVHQMSKRNHGPFVAVHCAALAKGLLESEIFGHEKGSFTGADQARVGRFEMAKGGTIFLDEVGEIPEETQVKLLRVLQERQIERVGGNRPIPVDIRLIAATHRNLEQLVKEGKFREDLFYRLNVIAVKIPPLRERKEDISILANYFLKKFSTPRGYETSLSPTSLAQLEKYDWPGNVRELENIIERSVILSGGMVIEPEDLNLPSEEILSTEKIDLKKLETPSSFREQIQQKEIEELKQVLIQNRGNVSEAARALNIPRTTLIHRLKKFKLL